MAQIHLEGHSDHTFFRPVTPQKWTYIQIGSGALLALSGAAFAVIFFTPQISGLFLIAPGGTGLAAFAILATASVCKYFASRDKYAFSEEKEKPESLTNSRSSFESSSSSEETVSESSESEEEASISSVRSFESFVFHEDAKKQEERGLSDDEQTIDEESLKVQTELERTYQQVLTVELKKPVDLDPPIEMKKSRRALLIDEDDEPENPPKETRSKNASESKDRGSPQEAVNDDISGYKTRIATINDLLNRVVDQKERSRLIDERNFFATKVRNTISNESIKTISKVACKPFVSQQPIEAFPYRAPENIPQGADNNEIIYFYTAKIDSINEVLKSLTDPKERTRLQNESRDLQKELQDLLLAKETSKPVSSQISKSQAREKVSKPSPKEIEEERFWRNFRYEDDEETSPLLSKKQRKEVGELEKNFSSMLELLKEIQSQLNEESDSQNIKTLQDERDKTRKALGEIQKKLIRLVPQRAKEFTGLTIETSVNSSKMEEAAPSVNSEKTESPTEVQKPRKKKRKKKTEKT